MTQHTGRCYCGDITYQITGPIQWRAQCHCRECQYISGGGPNYFMIVAADDFTITAGMPAQFTRSDLEAPRTRDFCPTCGTHLVTRLPDRPAVVVKVGTLDDPAVYGRAEAAIFCCDQQPFHIVDTDVPTFDKRPPR